MQERFDWLKPSRLRQADGQDFRQPDFFQPQLLQFQSDDFMEEFLEATAAPKADAFKQAVLSVAPASKQPLKLFQPAHGCFYLVCASLCCRQPGFPDRLISTPDSESVFFVLRKFINGAEYGWVVDDTRKGWQPLNGQGRTILEKEERLPLLKTQSGDQRSLWFGYLPVASRETYAVPPREVALGTKSTDIRIEDLKARFQTPLTKPQIGEDTAIEAAQRASAKQALILSLYILLDVWEFFERYLPDVAAALHDASAASSDGQLQAKQALLGFLRGQALGGSLTLAMVLDTVGQQHEALDQLGEGDPATLGFTDSFNLGNLPRNTLTTLAEGLVDAVGKALPTEAPPFELPKFVEPKGEASYAVRCIYERPQCEHPVYASQPSAPFQLAPYFDSSAPARPVRIPLPTDVSIAGLRKFNKSVTFLISNSLQRKISRLTGKEKDLLKDNPSLNAEQDDGLAFICSFSIQIIFIVAFMLLIIFVIIFNLVFWWIAFFRICLPVPKKLLSG
jgi:hypothetical protein